MSDTPRTPTMREDEPEIMRAAWALIWLAIGALPEHVAIFHLDAARAAITGRGK